MKEVLNDCEPLSNKVLLVLYSSEIIWTGYYSDHFITEVTFLSAAEWRDYCVSLLLSVSYCCA